jgi:hypothetical protein
MSLSTDSTYLKLISSRLRNFKQKSAYLWNFSCPICGDSQKNKSKARGYAFAKGNSLFYRCHNCAASTNIGNLIKQVDPAVHKEYVLERYKTGETNKVVEAPLPLKTRLPIIKQKYEHAVYVSELPDGHYCKDYVIARNIPKEKWNKLLFTEKYLDFINALVPDHGKNINNDARLVIPFFNKDKELVAVSGRALGETTYKLRYVTLRTNDSEDKLIYGLDTINQSEVIQIVEGPIDSLFLNNTIASGDANLNKTAESMNVENVVLVFDNEPRNKEIVKMIQTAIKAGRKVVIWPDTMIGKDINEMIQNGVSAGEVQDIISNNTFQGVKANLKFNYWKKI